LEKLNIPLPIIVEGKYDKHRLQSVCDALIITTDGFGVFKGNEKRELLRRLASKSKIIVFTDSDGGGLVIRNYINNILPRNSVINLYIPGIKGKESRKNAPSKEGLLGVEGIDNSILRNILLPYASLDGKVAEYDFDPLTKADLYADGYSGSNLSAQRRQKLLAALSLPLNLSSNALIEAINMLGLREEYNKFTENIKNDNQN